MNRKEYITQLAELLQDISEEERAEALQYYNDYFDEAGKENEQQVIIELGNPEKVAAEMKAGLSRESEDSVEFRETGYSDIRFEEKDSPVTYQGKEQKKEKSTNQYEYTGNAVPPVQENKPWTSKGLKMVLIILLILCAAPVALPLVFTGLVIGILIICIPVAIVAALFGVGVSLFVTGITNIIGNTATGLVLMGVGLILGSLGLAGIVFVGVLCFRLIVKVFNWMVSFCKKLFSNGKAVA